MAPIAGPLIEYFVVGCVAALWALPLVITAITLHPALQKDSIVVLVAILVPTLYVVGMVCDLGGQMLTHSFKERIEAEVRRMNNEAEVSSQKIHAFAVAFEPALAKQLDARSVRDRIARGSLVAVLPLLFYSPYSSSISRGFAFIAGLGVITALAMLWYRVQRLSAGYEIQVLKVLREKYPEATKNSFPGNEA